MAKKILVIDDDHLTTEILATCLESEHFEVVSAADGEEGLEKAKGIKPDLIILDILMPKMNGYTFVRRLKFDIELRHIPVIILSGQDKMKDLFAIEGISDYLVKPLKEDELLAKVKKYLG